MILRLRYPIAAVEHINVSDKWFYVDKFDVHAPPPVVDKRTDAEKVERAERAREKAQKAAAKEAKEGKEGKESSKSSKAGKEEPKPAKEEPKPAKAAAPVPVNVPAKATEAPKPVAAKPVAAATPKAPAKVSAQDDDDDDEDPDTFESFLLCLICSCLLNSFSLFLSVDSIVSNGVLEWEETQLTEKIKALKGKAPEEITDRLQAVQIKMNILVLQVQSGKLSMEGNALTPLLCRTA